MHGYCVQNCGLNFNVMVVHATPWFKSYLSVRKQLMGAVNLAIQSIHPMEVFIVTYFRTAIIILLGLYWNMAQATGPTNEELDAAWTAEDDARAAAQRVPAQPSSVSKDPLGDLTGEADMIIHGTVTLQTFVYDADGTPFTETTFAVSEVLKGDFAGDQFTLVQEGGVEQDDSSIVMTSSNSRHFTVGEEEILLLGPETGSGGVSRGADFDSDSSIRSTTREVQIRFRVYGGQAYDEEGRGVFVETLEGGGQRLALSRDRNPAALFSEIRIGSHTFTKFVSGSGSDGEQDGPAGRAPERVATPSYTDGTDAGTLITAIKN